MPSNISPPNRSNSPLQPSSLAYRSCRFSWTPFADSCIGDSVPSSCLPAICIENYREFQPRTPAVFLDCQGLRLHAIESGGGSAITIRTIECTDFDLVDAFEERAKGQTKRRSTTANVMAMMSEDSLATLEISLRETLHKEVEESERRQKAAEIQKLVWEERRNPLSSVMPPHLSTGTAPGDLAKQSTDSAVKIVHAKEQEIEKRKLQVREKVQAQLNRVESEARSLDQLRKELEGLEDPTKQEVAEIRKKIEVVDRELRPLKHICEKKEKELKEALETYNEKTKIKTDLVGRLMDIVTESERQRMQKLEELNLLLEEMDRRKGLR